MAQAGPRFFGALWLGTYLSQHSIIYIAQPDDFEEPTNHINGAATPTMDLKEVGIHLPLPAAPPELEFKKVSLGGSGLRRHAKMTNGSEEGGSKGLSTLHLPEQVEGSGTVQGAGQEVGLLKKHHRNHHLLVFHGMLNSFHHYPPHAHLGQLLL